MRSTVAVLITKYPRLDLAVVATIPSHCLMHSAWSGTHASVQTMCWARSCLNSWIGTKHAYTRPKLAAAERHHVLAYMGCHNLTMLRIRVLQDILNQIVAILIACNIDQWNAWTFVASFTDPVQVSFQKIGTTNFETLFDNLRSELIHAVFSSITNDMVNGTATVGGSPVLTDVLNAPITKLTMGHDIDACEDFFDTGTLSKISPKIAAAWIKSYLIFLEAVFEDILHHQASGFA